MSATAATASAWLASCKSVIIGSPYVSFTFCKTLSCQASLIIWLRSIILNRNMHKVLIRLSEVLVVQAKHLS